MFWKNAFYSVPLVLFVWIAPANAAAHRFDTGTASGLSSIATVEPALDASLQLASDTTSKKVKQPPKPRPKPTTTTRPPR